MLFPISENWLKYHCVESHLGTIKAIKCLWIDGKDGSGSFALNPSIRITVIITVYYSGRQNRNSKAGHQQKHYLKSLGVTEPHSFHLAQGHV